MVQTLVEGWPAHAPDISLHHVNPQLSRDAGDIGRWRPGKLLALLRACGSALRLRLRHGPMTLYYVPAPGKRSALYRDWLVLLLCRPFFPQLVLHWHAVGLGEWLDRRAIAPERWISRWLLGRADLAIVLAPELAADAARLAPRRIAVVPNGLDAARPSAPSPRSDDGGASPPRRPTRLLYVGACLREKGVFDLLTAVALANQREPGQFQLTVAGAFASEVDAHVFRIQADALGAGVVRHAGFVDATERARLFAAADVFCFPTAYAHEGQPLVLIEALAADLPIITTRWRAIPGMLPSDGAVTYVEPHRPDQLAAALGALGSAGTPSGRHRAHYLAHFTRDRHLVALAGALRASIVSGLPLASASSDPVLRQAARGYRATVVTQVVRMACKALSVLVLARLVSPEDHGLFAMAATLFGALTLFRDLGLGTAAVQAPVLNETQRTTLFWASVGLGVVLCAATLGASRAIAGFYAAPALVPLLAVMSSAFLLIGVGGFMRAQLLRELQFDAANRIETWSVVVGTIVMIAIGALGGGAYAFAGFLVSSEAVATVLAWRAQTWRPAGSPRWSSLRGLLRTGGAVTVHQLLGYVLQQLDTIVIGRRFGAQPLGLYNRANQLLALPHLYVAAPLGQVLLAALSRIPAGSAEFRRHAWGTVNTVAHLVLPLFAVCLVVPAETVRVVLGPQWPGAAPLIQVLAAGALAAAISALAYAVSVAAGAAGRLVGAALFTLPFTVLAITLGARSGVVGIAAGIAAVNVALALPRAWWLLRDVPGGLAGFCRALRGPFTAMLVTMLGLWAGRTFAGAAAGWVLRLALALGGAALALALAGACLPPLRREWRLILDYLPGRVPSSRESA
jgi:PST family polysaccharide transporter